MAPSFETATTRRDYRPCEAALRLHCASSHSPLLPPNDLAQARSRSAWPRAGAASGGGAYGGEPPWTCAVSGRMMEGKEDVMQNTLTPPSTERHGPGPVRMVAGWTVAFVAMFFTSLTALLAIAAPGDSKPDVAWALAALAAVIAIASWLAALLLTRMSGWALYLVAAVLMLLSAVGVYGGARGSETGVLVISLVAIPAWVATVLWNRTGTTGRA